MDAEGRKGRDWEQNETKKYNKEGRDVSTEGRGEGNDVNWKDEGKKRGRESGRNGPKGRGNSYYEKKNK